MNYSEDQNPEIEEFISLELNELKKENLIKDFYINQKSNVEFTIVTLEGNDCEIEYIRESGYKIKSVMENCDINISNDKIYETFECLLNDISLSYKQTFLSKLVNRLENLKEES
jgi:hypothetical protein